MQLLHTNTNIIFTLTGDKQLQSHLIVLSTQFLIDSGTSNLKHPISLVSTEHRDKRVVVGGGFKGGTHLYVYSTCAHTQTHQLQQLKRNFFIFSFPSPVLSVEAVMVWCSPCMFINWRKAEKMMLEPLGSVGRHGAGRRLWLQFLDIAKFLCGLFSGSPSSPPQSTDMHFWLTGKLPNKGAGELTFIV